MYKSRSLAAEAIKKGRVKLNSEPVKPAHMVKVGETYTLSFPQQSKKVIEVTALLEKRQSFDIARQDATAFKFNKHVSSYTFYTSHGTVSAPQDVLLQGYSPISPVDTFSAHYSYTSKLNLINIPVQANWHFLAGEKLDLSAGIGLNMSYVISRQTHLSLIKEHLTNDIYTSQVNVNRLNASLLLSLGCDIRLRRHLYLTLAPAYRYGLNNMSATPGIQFRPGYFSGSAGISIRF